MDALWGGFDSVSDDVNRLPKSVGAYAPLMIDSLESDSVRERFTNSLMLLFVGGLS